MTTEAERKELRALEQAATPGPWTMDDPMDGIYIFGPDNEMVAELRGFGAHLPSGVNGALIASFRTAVIELLDENAELREVIGQVRDRIVCAYYGVPAHRQLIQRLAALLEKVKP